MYRVPDKPLRLLFFGHPHPGTVHPDWLLPELVSQTGFTVQCEYEESKLLTCLLAGAFDVVVFDATAHSDFLSAIRAQRDIPLLVLADSTELCLESSRTGVDDFILKPCRPAELSVRIQALIERRRRDYGPCWLHFGPLTINVRGQEASLDGELLDLTHSELTILKCLVSVPYKTVTRDELAHALYQRQASPYERSIDVHISNLRRKLEVSGGVRIRSVRGVGYMLSTDMLRAVDKAQAS